MFKEQFCSEFGSDYRFYSDLVKLQLTISYVVGPMNPVLSIFVFSTALAGHIFHYLCTDYLIC